MTNDVRAVEAAMNLMTLDWNVYGRALENIKEGRISAEDPEELRRYLELASDVQRKLDKARMQFIQDLLSGKASEESVKQFYNQLLSSGREFLQAMKALKIKQDPSPSQELSEMMDLLDLIVSSTPDPTGRAQAQKVREAIDELMKEGLV
jgi:hypothetical protein